MARRKQSNKNGYKEDARFSGNKRSGRSNHRVKGGNSDRKGDAYYEDTDGTRQKSDNDASWYSADPALLRDSASIPFSYSAGGRIRLSGAGAVFTGKAPADITDNGLFSTPGCFALYLAPTLGWNEVPSDPINVAADAYYTLIRSANSGARNYDAPDLMMKTLAMADIYSYIVFLQRLYGLSTLYSPVNKYLPDEMIKLCGADPVNLRQHRANFRYGINVLINKAASLAVPADKTLFERKAFLYRDVYVEGTSIKDQMYMYVPQGFFVLNQMVEGEPATHLVYSPFQVGTLQTFDELLDYGETLLSGVYGQQEIATMCGDILKAYGSNIIKLAELPDVYPVMPIFNIGVLEQMKNATIINHVKFSSLDVTQDNVSANSPFIISKPQLGVAPNSTLTLLQAQAQKVYTESRILTTTTADTSPELVMESSRLMAIATGFSTSLITGTTNYTINGRIVCGTELCVNAKYVTAIYKGDTIPPTFREIGYNDYVYSFDEVADTGALLIGKSRFWTLVQNGHFRFRPAQHYVCNAAGEGNNMIDLGINFDVDNYTVITTDILERLHQTAIISMLHSPLIAKLRG